jgi:hypothetical protein
MPSFPIDDAQATQRGAGSMIAATRRPVQLLQRKNTSKEFAGTNSHAHHFSITVVCAVSARELRLRCASSATQVIAAIVA